jgi:ribosomal protein L34E
MSPMFDFSHSRKPIIIESKITNRPLQDVETMRPLRFHTEHLAHRYMDRHGMNRHCYIVRKETDDDRRR